MSRRDAAEVLHRLVPAPPSGVTWRPSYADYHVKWMRDLDDGSFEAPTLHRFESYKRIALFESTATSEPKMVDCAKRTGEEYAQVKHADCGLQPGTLAGNVVVFDEAGRPVCGVTYELVGPVTANIRGNDSVGNHMSDFLVMVLDELFYAGATPATSKTWAFLAHPSDLLHEFLERPDYRLTIDGVVAFAPQI